MKLIKIALTYLLVFSIPLPSAAGWFDPSNYDECILESMKGVTSDKAALLIARSCRQEFPNEPENKPDSRALSYEELSKLTGRAGHGYGNYYSGNIYNGNSNVTISEITISVTTKIDGKEVTRAYIDDVSIRPQTTADFGFSIVTGDKDADYSWGVSGARGY